MSDYISRLIEEKDQLMQRMAKLATFTASEEFRNLYQHQQELLQIQYHAMHTYNVCLTARIRQAKKE